MVKFLISLPRRQKQLLMILCDLFLIPVTFWVAVALRHSTMTPEFFIPMLYWVLLCLPLLAIPIFIPLGLYRTVVRYADEKLIATVAYGVTLLTLALMGGVFMTGIIGIPRSSFVIFWLLAVTLIGVSRFAARKIILRAERRHLVEKRERIAIYGAGRAGVQLAMALSSSPEYQVLAFFDDNSDLHGTTLFGVRVHSPDQAAKIVANYDLQGLILALPSSSRSRRREIIQNFEEFGLSLKTLPGMAELVGGKVRIEDLREVGIEDLLGRDPVPPNESLLATCIENKNVLVTGAGGSIGSELCRQIVRINPKTLILFESSEYALYKMEQELRQYERNALIVPILGDVRNRSQVEATLKKYEVETVYHAAAYKHVPLVEKNSVMGIFNNVIGTLTMAQEAVSAEVKTFVLVSTDKAVRPTNVMGASKRLAELILQALSSSQVQSGTRFCMVRFGNVLGSSGSVVPLFKEQIRRGGPLTITHPEVTRYFMTIPEAAQLVLQAGSMGKGGDVFVLDMGESVKIVDLAKKMIQLSGLSVRDQSHPEGDISIQYVGLRPGEKLYEELLIGDNVSKTDHPRILRAEETFIPWTLLKEELSKLAHACQSQDPLATREILKKCVIEYVSVDHPEDEAAEISSERVIN